ncbi:hypothetical protein P8452_05254 [Trifolium repens]|nr:hypothetical protein P8452_05254 [Trifolium repens]
MVSKLTIYMYSNLEAKTVAPRFLTFAPFPDGSKSRIWSLFKKDFGDSACYYFFTWRWGACCLLLNFGDSFREGDRLTLLHIQ